SLKANSTSPVSERYIASHKGNMSMAVLNGQKFRFNAPGSRHYDIRLFDLKGRMIKKVYNGHLPEGQHVMDLPRNLGAGTFLLKTSSAAEEKIFRFESCR
ncbi:MAG: hypothetical protein ACLFQB_03810, partial [Chitinispirillaceae bacterium]